MSTLVEIEKAAQRLSAQEKRELRLFLDAQLEADTHRHAPRNLPPAERAADLRRWADSHEDGPGLPEWAVGRDAIYD